ncbi:3'-5' exonuclease [Mycobacterium sp. KBS0706]|uniref:3'-5' exonuclease n=1 Tax=Mycobacterium sp. KBS0706 TaxID=2578109 RepID=UPI00110F70B8|nr:3'-5' exonuclease [Mycobacterium sp. KBS0706]TSD82851.1 3'-5' exonuclease [Mycobacterium sp. KBS0706]
MSGETDLELMASTLEASGRYRVLRKLENRRLLATPDGTPTRLGILLDLETTGLDPAKDEIIELAMVPFTYGLDGRIFEIHEPFQRLRQPSVPIPAEITALTGIDDTMVAGLSIDTAEVEAFAAPAALIVAHNAGFDRKFAERFCDVFTTKPWACSWSQVPWAEEGFEGGKLRYLAIECGFYFDGHRAADDCVAVLEILARPLPRCGVTALARLLETARKPTCRIWAENSPFDFKDILKARGYRWNGEANGRPRSWYFDVDEDRLEQELAYLRHEIYQYEASIPVIRFGAHDRFSDRC